MAVWNAVRKWHGQPRNCGATSPKAIIPQNVSNGGLDLVSVEPCVCVPLSSVLAQCSPCVCATLPPMPVRRRSPCPCNAHLVHGPHTLVQPHPISPAAARRPCANKSSHGCGNRCVEGGIFANCHQNSKRSHEGVKFTDSKQHSVALRTRWQWPSFSVKNQDAQNGFKRAWEAAFPLRGYADIATFWRLWSRASGSLIPWQPRCVLLQCAIDALR